MWIQVRTMDGKVAHTVDSLSRLTKVEELRKKIQELFHVEPGLQRLFYRGKQVNSLCRLPACLPTTFVLALSRQGTHTLSPSLPPRPHLVRSASPQKPPVPWPSGTDSRYPELSGRIPTWKRTED